MRIKCRKRSQGIKSVKNIANGAIKCGIINAKSNSACRRLTGCIQFTRARSAGSSFHKKRVIEGGNKIKSRKNVKAFPETSVRESMRAAIGSVEAGKIGKGTVPILAKWLYQHAINITRKAELIRKHTGSKKLTAADIRLVIENFV
jgi:histone H3/H4